MSSGNIIAAGILKGGKKLSNIVGQRQATMNDVHAVAISHHYQALMQQAQHEHDLKTSALDHEHSLAKTAAEAEERRKEIQTTEGEHRTTLTHIAGIAEGGTKISSGKTSFTLKKPEVESPAEPKTSKPSKTSLNMKAAMTGGGGKLSTIIPGAKTPKAPKSKAAKPAATPKKVK